MPTPLLERHAVFAKTFVETFAPEILKVYVQQVELYVTQKAWLSRKVIYKIVQFLTEWSAASSLNGPQANAYITASSPSLPGCYSSPSSKALSLSLSSPNSASVSTSSNYGGMIPSTTCESLSVSLAHSNEFSASHTLSLPEEYEDYQSPASAASSFLLTMATGRTKTTFIPILSLAQSVLTGGEYVFPFAASEPG